MTSSRYSIALLAGIAVIALASSQAAARERNVEWQGSGGHGGTTHTAKERNQDRSGWSGSRETVLDNGKTATSQKNVNKTDNGYAVSGSRTGYNGNTQSYEKDVNKTENGWSSSGSYETGNGKSGAVQTQGNRTENGWERNGSYQTNGGKSGTFNQSGQKTEDGYEVNTNVTNQDRETATRRSMYNVGDGTYSKEVDQTGFKGRTRHWERSGNYNQ